MDAIKNWVDQGRQRGRPARSAGGSGVCGGMEAGQARYRHRYRRELPGQAWQDAYEHFTVPTNLTEGRWIRAAEIRPGNRQVVHHVHVNLVRDERESGPTSIEAMTALSSFLLRDGKLTRIREEAPVVDDACAAGAPDLPYLRGFQEGALASFLPGRAPDVFPDGSAKWIPPGSKLEFVIHYARTSGGPQTDRTSVGLYLAPRAPDRVLRRMDLRNFFFRIPPGAANHEVRRCYSFRGAELLLLHHSAHALSGQGRAVRTAPSERRSRDPALRSRLRFDWQLVYRFRDPIRVEKGSVLTVTAHYDNSPNNRANPDPTQAMRWGDKSEEEMMTSWIEYFDPATSAQPRVESASKSALEQPPATQ